MITPRRGHITSPPPTMSSALPALVKGPSRTSTIQWRQSLSSGCTHDRASATTTASIPASASATSPATSDADPARLAPTVLRPAIICRLGSAGCAIIVAAAGRLHGHHRRPRRRWPQGQPRQPRHPPTRYRDPGDVLHLLASAAVLLVAVVMVAIFADQLLGSNASVVSGAEPDTEAGRLLVGVAQVLAVGSATGLAAFLLWRRRYRLLLTLLLGALIAGLGMIGLMHLLAPDQPPDLVTNRHHGSWLAGSAFPSAAYFAGGCAVLVTLTPWLSRAWRRTLWILLATAAVARLVAGTALPAELVVAAAIGATVGFGLLVAFGTPDRRIGPSGVADALTASGLSIAGVRAADVEAKGCRPFVATTADGPRLFVKLFGKDQRQADLLYRAYRYGRLKGVGHSRPAASLIQSVEHQALAEIMAERAGVRVPRVERIAQAPDGLAMLAMDFVHGRSLNQVPAEGISEELRRSCGVRSISCTAGIAHRSLRSGNVMLDTANQTRIVDFSFSELAATERQRSLDVAELLASTAARSDRKGPWPAPYPAWAARR